MKQSILFFSFWLMLSCGSAPTTSPSAPTGGGSGGGSTPTVTAPYQGYATNFQSPTGITACGIPPSIEPQDFVALNSQSTPGNYSTALKFPVSPASDEGAYSNGLNCGRWVKVEIGNACIGAANGGEPGQGFCKGGNWEANAVTGAYLDMLVADACPDENEFCRDSQYHLDIHTSALSHFILNGKTVDVSTNWNNPEISWNFIPAPNYQGDIKIGFAQNANSYWTAIMISNLPNGIHGVESLVNGVWQKATMNTAVGQTYILASSSKSPYTIRVYDANDQLINNGKTYTFSLPASCSSKCSGYTPVTFD